jgi:hypothetical protein
MSSSVVLNNTTGGAGTQPRMDTGICKGCLVATGVVTLVAGLATVTVGSGLITDTSTLLVTEADARANANAGLLTIAKVAPVPPAGYISLSITSNNASDVGNYRWLIYA